MLREGVVQRKLDHKENTAMRWPGSVKEPKSSWGQNFSVTGHKHDIKANSEIFQQLLQGD